MGVVVPRKPPLHRPKGYKGPEVARREYDQRRAKEKNAIYDAAWRRVRKDYLAKHPVCCQVGCGAAATDVDHIESVRDRPELRLTWSNLRGFCHSCHSARTSRDHSWNGYRGVGV